MSIEIIESSQEVRFSYNGEEYKYLWQSSRSYGVAYVQKNGVLIYGPYSHQCTDEGREVYEAYVKHRK